MNVSLKPLDEQVMVITGASSGIGLATARAAAAAGAKLVLTARSDEALAEIAREITAAGGEAIDVAADVTRREDVERVADVAIDRFGAFDTWVNNAGVSIFGKMEDVSDDDHRRLFETNFWGAVNGSLVAIKHLKQHGGALINIGSVASDIAIPIQGMYSASKHALRGFTDALRMELDAERAPVSVTLVKPASINTPFPHHARNYQDREPQAPPPIYPPEEVARAILRAATHVERNLYVGGASRLMSVLSQFAPAAVDWIGRNFMAPREKRNAAPRRPHGNLFQPSGNGRVQGDHPGYVHKSSLYTRAALHPMLTGTLMIAAGAAAAALLAGSRSETGKRRR